MVLYCYGCRNLKFVKDDVEGAEGSFMICAKADVMVGYVGKPSNTDPLLWHAEACGEYNNS